MKICAIIAEFNPFHLGHKKLIEQARQKTLCDHIFCFMGQNFNERATPCLLDKTIRAKMAVLGGCDAVFEIPNALTILNAEMFANFTIKAVSSFSNITHICFGSECGNIDAILELASFLNNEPKEYKLALKNFLEQGFSLNISKQKALNFVIDNNICSFKSPKITKTLLSYPNNILAVEYAKVLLRENLKLTPITFKRESKISATEIRKVCMEEKNIKKAKQMLDEESFNILTKSQTMQNFPNTELYNNIKLLNARLDALNLSKIFDVSEGLDKKIYNESIKSTNYDDFLCSASGKRYTKNRIERILLSNVLKIDKTLIKQAFSRKYLPYLKVVALRDNKKMMPEITKSKSKIILRKNDADFILQNNSLARKLNEIDNKCERLYSLLTQKKPNEDNLFVKTKFIK